MVFAKHGGQDRKNSRHIQMGWELLTSDERSRNDRKQRNDEWWRSLRPLTAKLKRKHSTKGATGQQRKSAKKSGRGPRCYKCNGSATLVKIAPHRPKKSNTSEKSKSAVTEALNAEVLCARSELYLGDTKATMDDVGAGRIDCEVSIDGKWLPRHLEYVLHVPSSRRNLFSQSCTRQRNATEIFRSRVRVYKKGKAMVRGVRSGRLFKMCARPSRRVREAKTSSFKSRQQRATTRGDVIHADLCGPMEVDSLGGARYFLCFTCDFTRHRIVDFLKEKSEAAAKIDEMVRLVSNLCGRSVKALQCDGGLEFNILKTEWMRERTNRTVVKLARTMMLARNMPKFLWAEAVNTAVHVLNRTGPSQVVGKSPYEAFTGKNARLEKLHAFGATCLCMFPRRDERSGIPRDSGARLSVEETVEDVATQRDPERNDDWFDANDATEQDGDKTLSEESLLESPGISPPNLRDRATIKAPDRFVHAMLTEIQEPINYQGAIRSAERRQKWKEAMKEEMESLEENSTGPWSSCQRVEDNLQSMVVRVKRGPDGEVLRHKARLFERRGGEGLKFAQFDIKTAFLNGLLEEEIYMDQPEGFQDGTDRVCKLEKSLYGLTQSPRCWNKKFKECYYALARNTVAEEVLQRFRMAEAKPVSTPIVQYLQANERKLHVAVSRATIGVAVDTGVKRIFRYLKGSTDKGIVYRANEAGLLHVYSDADYASDPVTRRSVSGMVSRCTVVVPYHGPVKGKRGVCMDVLSWGKEVCSGVQVELGIHDRMLGGHDFAIITLSWFMWVITFYISVFKVTIGCCMS
ncbi:uncharacterized protein LOC114928935 [Nylanderia fulva]|uniref:uncharacterized protein LOC114928935 n=1 Tax=Nylanderia fulva TaxID=613905 RepID=UPI0010FB5F42|nr:uncharacterized protein LOC114928935 [Nylanderia fulva]